MILVSPFTECRDDRITPEMFIGFLKSYMTYWHCTYVNGHIPEIELQKAKYHAILYAKEHGMKLIFKEMDFRLKLLR
jgi:hypothetical protein